MDPEKFCGTLASVHPLFLNSKALVTSNGLDVFDKWSQQPFDRVSLADANLLDQAIAGAVQAQPAMQTLPAYIRRDVLQYVAKRLTDQRDGIARTLSRENGKTLGEARNEVSRAIDVFALAAEESTRIEGRVMAGDVGERSRNYRLMYRRVAAGPCALISPFNFPLNLVAHKVAPAIAAGCTFILKPASATPMSALALGHILAESALPQGAFSILPMSSHDANALVEDDRIKVLSFTGSPAVGWQLKAKAGKKRVVLELGGNAAVLVQADADLTDAAERIAQGAYAQAGQSCISVQRIIVHATVYEKFRAQFTAITQQRFGESLTQRAFDLERSALGPMISEKEAVRLERWIHEATQAGARVIFGAKRDGAFFSPTLLENVPVTSKIYCQEAFGPVATLEPFTNFEEALAHINKSHYGIQAGVFTSNLHEALQSWDQLEVGGVVINDVPTFRIDAMPYGGVKESGLGREGVRFAIEDMTEIKTLMIRTPDA